MTWSQLTTGAGIPPTTRNTAFRKFAAIMPENLESAIGFFADFPLGKRGFPARIVQISSATTLVE